MVAEDSVPVLLEYALPLFCHRNALTRIAEDAEQWIGMNKPIRDSFFQELKDAQGSETLKLVNGAPIGYIREVKEDGSDVFIGNISIVRCAHGELMNTDNVDWERAAQNKADNEKIELGDPNIIWSIGGEFVVILVALKDSRTADYLAPSHHGQGIMTDAIDTLLHDWAVPRMGVRRVLTGAFVGNMGSVKVFEKNGFKMVRTVAKHSVVRGKQVGMHVFHWSFDQGSIDF